MNKQKSRKRTKYLSENKKCLSENKKCLSKNKQKKFLYTIIKFMNKKMD